MSSVPEKSDTYPELFSESTENVPAFSDSDNSDGESYSNQSPSISTVSFKHTIDLKQDTTELIEQCNDNLSIFPSSSFNSTPNFEKNLCLPSNDRLVSQDNIIQRSMEFPHSNDLLCPPLTSSLTNILPQQHTSAPNTINYSPVPQLPSSINTFDPLGSLSKHEKNLESFDTLKCETVNSVYNTSSQLSSLPIDLGQSLQPIVNLSNIVDEKTSQNHSTSGSLPIRACRLRRSYVAPPSRSDPSGSSSRSSSSEYGTEECYSPTSSEGDDSDKQGHRYDDPDDDDDSDYAAPSSSRTRSRRRSSRMRGRIGGLRTPAVPRRIGRPRGSTIIHDDSNDSGEESLSWAGSRVIRNDMRRRRGKGSDDSDGCSSWDSLKMDGVKLTNRNRKRWRQSNETSVVVAPRLSARQTVKGLKVNYAELGMGGVLSEEEEEEDEPEVDNNNHHHDIKDNTILSHINNHSLSSLQIKTKSIDRIIGYRLIGTTADSSVVPLPLLDGDIPPGIHDVELLVKWVHKSHLHNTWETLENLKKSNISGMRKVENFFRRMDLLRIDRKWLTEDEIEQQNISLELQKQIDMDCLIAERIVSHRIDSSPREPYDSTFNEEVNEEKVSIDMYFVKWTNSPYDQCTWESQSVLKHYGFESFITEYWERESRIVGQLSAHHPLHSHALSRTSFEPYRETPFFLGNENNKTAQKQLRDYQLTGINWMISRMKKGLSVLLADEMGLGKTVQTISVIGHMMFSELIAGPYLVVVPQSTADNWLNEFKFWLPSANVIVYHGNPIARDVIREHELCRVRAAPFVYPTTLSSSSIVGRRIAPTGGRRIRFRCDVCICTPSILNNVDDLEILRSVDWFFMAIDEAHLLKNRESRRFRELNLFKTKYRLLLSGTPLHNNLEELWSLLHFLSPRVYEDLDLFKKRFSEIERTDSMGELKERQLTTLQRELNEIVLRRVKKDVEKSLPKKLERILRIELSPKQSNCCKAIIARNYEALAKSSGSSKASLQNICMELKKVCNHPLLLQKDVDIYNLQSAASLSLAKKQEWHQLLLYSSGKLALLDKLLPFLRDKDHRVLIFSQMVRMLNILSIYLTLRGFKYQKLDGTMPREVRKKAMDHFNAPDSDDFCFLLSTKAGGLGINLTTADTVIIYDSDWNPQNDLQAEARAHRIGQTKTVQIYRLVTKDTIEEKILERAKAKMVLDTLVVQGLNKRESVNKIESDSLTQTSDDTGNTPSLLSHSNLHNNLSQDKFGFSKEELSRILKFGASKLWNDPGQQQHQQLGSGLEDTSSLVVDLDKILAEAEEHNTEGSGGLADGLFSSFTNVSDFRYEAPPDPPEYDDKSFWDKAIPLMDREKYDTSLSTNLIIMDDIGLGRKRHRKQVERTGVILNPGDLEDDTDEEEEEEHQEEEENEKLDELHADEEDEEEEDRVSLSVSSSDQLTGKDKKKSYSKTKQTLRINEGKINKSLTKKRLQPSLERTKRKKSKILKEDQSVLSGCLSDNIANIKDKKTVSGSRRSTQLIQRKNDKKLPTKKTVAVRQKTKDQHNNTASHQSHLEDTLPDNHVPVDLKLKAKRTQKTHLDLRSQKKETKNNDEIELKLPESHGINQDIIDSTYSIETFPLTPDTDDLSYSAGSEHSMESRRRDTSTHHSKELTGKKYLSIPKKKSTLKVIIKKDNTVTEKKMTRHTTKKKVLPYIPNKSISDHCTPIILSKDEDDTIHHSVVISSVTSHPICLSNVDSNRIPKRGTRRSSVESARVIETTLPLPTRLYADSTSSQASLIQETDASQPVASNEKLEDHHPPLMIITRTNCRSPCLTSTTDNTHNLSSCMLSKDYTLIEPCEHQFNKPLLMSNQTIEDPSINNQQELLITNTTQESNDVSISRSQSPLRSSNSLRLTSDVGTRYRHFFKKQAIHDEHDNHEPCHSD